MTGTAFWNYAPRNHVDGQRELSVDDQDELKDVCVTSSVAFGVRGQNATGLNSIRAICATCGFYGKFRMGRAADPFSNP